MRDNFRFKMCASVRTTRTCMYLSTSFVLMDFIRFFFRTSRRPTFVINRVGRIWTVKLVKFTTKNFLSLLTFVINTVTMLGTSQFRNRIFDPPKLSNFIGACKKKRRRVLTHIRTSFVSVAVLQINRFECRIV